jgi:hypothetical protein
MVPGLPRVQSETHALDMAVTRTLLTRLLLGLYENLPLKFVSVQMGENPDW